MWIKSEKPVEKTGQVTSQVQKKKRLSPSTRKGKLYTGVSQEKRKEANPIL
jgi:hypothetical protein